MTIEANVIAFHVLKAECWRSKGYSLFADAHEKRATAISHGAALTDKERDGNALDVMSEVADSVR